VRIPELPFADFMRGGRYFEWQPAHFTIGEVCEVVVARVKKTVDPAVLKVKCGSLDVGS
jgi:hypothetical protein